MKSNHFSDKEIERLLNDVPKIIDQRSKQDVYARLITDPRIINKGKESTLPGEIKLRRKINWMPAIATLIVIVLLVMLLPTMMDLNFKGSITVKNMNSKSMEQSTEKNVLEKASTEMMYVSTIQRTNVYAEDVGEDDVILHLSMIRSPGVRLPVTVIIPGEQIKADFGDVQPTTDILYAKYVSEMKETLGLDGNENQENVANMNSITQAKESSESLVIDEFQSKYYGYFIYQDVNRTGKDYLTPDVNRQYDFVIDAMKGLSVTDNDDYDSAIPEDVTYTVSEKNGLVKISFTEPLDLRVLDSNQTMQMIEAFTLTAASFDKQVQLENVVQGEWNSVSLTEPLPIPLGPNKIDISQ